MKRSILCQHKSLKLNNSMNKSLPAQFKASSYRRLISITILCPAQSSFDRNAAHI
jgi:hypothetical protein